MSTLSIESRQDSSEIIGLVKAAIQNEIVKIELGLSLAEERLQTFEAKYGVTSDFFIEKMAAEDLEGKDEEYVRWAGEYKLMQRLQYKLNRLKEIDYDDPGLL